VAAITLRAYVFLDQMQDQLAGFVGTTARGYLPVGGVAAYFIETAPGLVINRLTDIALKATSVTPGLLVVERSFGLLEVHHRTRARWRLAGKAVLDHLGIGEEERLKPRVVSQEVIRGVEPYLRADHQQDALRRHADRRRVALHPGVEPAGYVAFAANEALKAARVQADRQPRSSVPSIARSAASRAASTWASGPDM